MRKNKRKNDKVSESRINLIDKNLKFLSDFDFQFYIKESDRKLRILTELIHDLIDALEVDDSIVYELAKGETLDLDKIKDATSIVKKFNMHSKFLTLADKHEEALELVLGKDIYKNKKELSKRNKWKSKKTNNK